MRILRGVDVDTRNIIRGHISDLATTHTARETLTFLRGLYPDIAFTITSVRNLATNMDVTFKRAEAQLADQDDKFETPREYKKLEIDDCPDGYRVIVVNDLQIPFQDAKTLTAVQAFWDDFEPDLEVYNGDIIDFYNISSFDKNPSRRFKLQAELDESFAWLHDRAEANPNARRVFIEGNHEDRLRRFLWRYAADLSSLRALEFEKLMRFDELKVEDLPYMSVLDLLGCQIEHGYMTSSSRAYPMNVSRGMAVATGSSGLCGHTHRFSVYSWTDSRGSHSYVENGCLCRFDLEYAAFPNWQQAFTYGTVYQGLIHLTPVQIYPTGFVANGELYRRGKKA